MTGGLVDAEVVRRLEPWFELQLTFAEAIAQATGCSFSEAVTLWTNIHRRCGLGSARKVPLSPRWRTYLEDIEKCGSTSQMAAQTVLLAEERFVPFSHIDHPLNEGCFSLEQPDGEGMVRIHFSPIDVDAVGGPLRRERIEVRRAELKRLFARLKSDHPNAALIRGTSWLYHLPAYRRLFPERYVASRRVREGAGLKLTGGSSWGQFIDHRGHLRQALADSFLANLTSIEHLDPNAVWKVFPLPAMIVEAPVTAFYHEFGI